MPKPKIVKDSDNFAIRFAGMQELARPVGMVMLRPDDAKKIADGIRSLRAERDELLKQRDLVIAGRTAGGLGGSKPGVWFEDSPEGREMARLWLSR